MTTETVSATPRSKRAVPRWLFITAAVLACVLLVVVIGAFVPQLPLVGLVGSGLSSATGYVTVLAVIVAIIAVLAVRAHRTRLRAVIAAIAVLTLIGSLVITTQLVTLGVSQGRSGNVFALPLADSPPDVTTSYLDADGKALSMAVWQPDPAVAGEAAPVALFVHGGGWILGDNLGNSGQKRWLADRGWLVLSADYSLSDETRHLWDQNDDEITCAMIWAGNNAAQLGGDMDRFVLLGDSAGGNLALTAGYQAAAGTATPACSGEVPEPAAVATVYPAVDPVSFHDNPDILMGPTARNMTESWLGGTPSEYPERYAAASSASWITPDAPPTLIVASENDHLVPKGGAVDFVNEATEQGVDVTRIGVPYAEHVFDLFPFGTSLYLGITERWLADVGLAPSAASQR